MKRLWVMAILAVVASAGMATPLFAGAFGLFYWGRHRCTSCYCGQAWNAFSPQCCPCEGGCGGCGGGCGYGCKGCGWGGACGGADCATCKPKFLFHGFKHGCATCGLDAFDGCATCGHKFHGLRHRLFGKHYGGVVSEGEVEGGVHDGQVIESTPAVKSVTPVAPAKPTSAAPPLAPVPPSESKQARSGIQSAAVDPRVNGTYYWQPVSYQTGYPVYPYAMPNVPMYGMGGYYPMPAAYYPGYSMPAMYPMGY